jgi:hypothetical protein
MELAETRGEIISIGVYVQGIHSSAQTTRLTDGKEVYLNLLSPGVPPPILGL